MQRSRSGGWESTVSVPSRGAIFLNLNKANMAEETKKTVSVPSRGAIFLNRRKDNLKIFYFRVSVPSRGAIFLNPVY